MDSKQVWFRLKEQYYKLLKKDAKKNFNSEGQQAKEIIIDYLRKKHSK